MDKLSDLKNKNRSELRGIFTQWSVNCRIWLQEHGEKAFLLGVGGGIIIALAFKVVVALVVLAVLAGCALWYVAPDESPSKSLPGASTNGTDDRPPSNTPEE